jgi:hypothetical protein
MSATATLSRVAALALLCILPLAARSDGPPRPPATQARGDSNGNGCEGEAPPPDAEKIDTMRAGLQRGVCSTARFVDRMFGRENLYSEYEDETNGRASVTLGWDEQDQLEADTRFHASVNLPQINERFSATIGARAATNTSPTRSGSSTRR